MATKVKIPLMEKDSRFHKELIKQLVALSTAGFGLVAALAWNEAVKAFVGHYIDPLLPNGSGVLSRFLYAIIITVFAVLVTYQLSKLSKNN